jgi:hypothetical protein
LPQSANGGAYVKPQGECAVAWIGLAADDAAKVWVFTEQILEEDRRVGEL